MIWGYHFRNPPSLLSPVKSQTKSRTAVTVGFQPRWCVVFYRAQQPEQHPGPLCLTDLSWQGQSLNGYTAEKWAKRGQARIGNLVSTGCIGAKDEMTRAAFFKAKSLRRFVAFVAHVGLGKSCWCQLTTRSWDLFAGKPTYFAYRNRNMSLTQRRVCFFCCLLQRLKSSPPDSWRSVSLKTFNDKQLGRHRFLQNHGIAATPSDLNGSYCFQFEASDKGFFHLLQAQNGPRIEIFAYLT